MGSGQSKGRVDGSSGAKNVSNEVSPVVPTETPRDGFPQDLAAGSEESKCPMHKTDGTYSYDWFAMFRKDFPHGPGGKKPISDEEARATLQRRFSVLDGGLASPGGGCPVHPGSVKSVSSSKHVEYNVYSQPIDPTNNMPQNPNQLPAPIQREPLSTNRVKSNIPKGGASEDSTWTYPSPQMFYNALARKGKLGETREHEIESVVALHNNMNEKTWKKVLEWEHTTNNETSGGGGGGDGEPPKLLKFMGRPKDLSPKAWLKHNLFGHPLPYDRHDWTILRKDGTTVRYVIDYYFDETKANEEGGGMPSIDDHTATPSLLVDVRPALDSPSQLWSRAITMPFSQLSGTARYQYMPLVPTAEMKGQVQESVDVWKAIQNGGGGSTDKKDDQDLNDVVVGVKLSEEESRALARDFAQAVARCKEVQKRVDRCESDDECTKASLDLTICMSKFLCPLQHAAFAKTLTEDDETSIQHSLERLGECVVLKSSQHDQLGRK